MRQLRHPAEETVYPELNTCVHDGRKTGSITAGRSRLPLWAFVPGVIHHGWDGMDESYELTTRYHYSKQDCARLLYHLLEQRGEFGRLLCELATVDIIGERRRDAALDALDDDRDGIVSFGPGDALPGGWETHDDLRQRVSAVLQRCLDTLEKV